MFYILEMLITTNSQIVSAVLGTYDSAEKAEDFAEKMRHLRPESQDVSFNVLPFVLNDNPSLLKIKEIAKDFYGEELLRMYKHGILDQMVNPDGSFSYVVTDSFKNALESKIYQPEK